MKLTNSILIPIISGIVSCSVLITGYLQKNQLQNKLELKQIEVDSLKQVLISYLSSSEGFAVLKFIPLSESSGQLKLFMKGKYPVNDVSISIVELDSLNQKCNSNKNLKPLGVNDLYIGTVYPKTNRNILVIDLKREKEMKMEFIIHQKNGDFIQVIEMKKINNNWLYSTNVIDSSNTIQYKYQDSGFFKR